MWWLRAQTLETDCLDLNIRSILTVCVTLEKSFKFFVLVIKLFSLNSKCYPIIIFFVKLGLGICELISPLSLY